MKKIIFFLLLSISFYDKSFAQQDYSGYFATTTTLTNVDTSKYEINVVGPKKEVSLQVNVTKVSGTIGGSIVVWGSVDGVNWITTALSTTTITNGDSNYSFLRTSNGFIGYG
jgi:hypothetical protein